MAGTVYILGAGASRAETLKLTLPTPLVNDFFSEQYIKKFWYDLDFGCKFTKSELYFILTQYFVDRGSSRDHPLENINIEEVYSFLHSFGNVFSGRSYRRDEFEVARRQLHKYIIYVVRYTSWKLERSIFLKSLCSKLNFSDSIITFNWDTLIDQALEEAETKPAKELASSLHLSASPERRPRRESDNEWVEQLHAGRLIKIHGAINLTHCKNNSCYRHDNPYVWAHSEESPSHWSCQECGSPTQEMILSPHGAKTYTTNRFFRMQANMAAEKLSVAEKIVVIGYSFPTFDIEARSMLRCSRLDDRYSEAWLNEVSIVDPSVVREEHVKAISNLIGVDNDYAHGHLVKLSLYKSVDEFMRANF
ncbi:SIR2 family protein [Methylobacter sp. YRD-M1]|uniref:SIR2 family protein n=1 Tax=Methylobacter sp. YRD-M1 TaxID=2911520 RepID=UPI00227D10FD|nr:SIR2 family protein [Methylobacter sp. YRD-M1]WAK01285.1 SIR2 family protein [Methylobacter sp. YRD-M1]